MKTTCRYRIYTELKNLENIAHILNSSFEGYTMYPARGVWKGIPEKALVIEIIEESAQEKVLCAARSIKEFNGQDAVFITTEKIEAELI